MPTRVKFERRSPAQILADMRIPEPVAGGKPIMDKSQEEVLKFYQPAFTALAALPADASAYPPMPKPRPGDWLAEHDEAGQPLRSFFRGQFKAQPHGSFNEIALIVLGDGFPPEILVGLKDYVAAFFQMKVSLYGPLPVEKTEPPIRTCVNAYTGKRQLFAGDAMHFAQKYIQADRARSRNVVAFMGVTMEDLTKDEDWNFLYGLASLCDGCGVFSMARFSPAFNGEHCASAEEEGFIILKRCCKVITHELCHIFGLKHCVHFGCLMNGVNHVDELNRQELLECPSCTQKLEASFLWDVTARFECLAATMAAFGFSAESKKIGDVIIPTIGSALGSAARMPPTAVGTRYKR